MTQSAIKFSLFGDSFKQKTGIVELMEDFGSAANTKEPTYMLGGGNPAHIPEIQQIFRQEMSKLLDDGSQFEQMVGNYDIPQGNTVFLEYLADLLKDNYGWPISSKNIALTNGSQSSFFVLFNMFAGNYADGSFKKILLPLAPEYIGYSDIAKTNSLFKSYKPEIQYHDDNFYKYRVDFDAIKNLEDIGAICVSRPTNPTGNVLTDNEINKLSSLAKSSAIALIIDCAYGNPFPNIIFTDAKVIWDEHIILCLSLSKLGLPGLRTGIVIANEQIIECISHLNAAHHLAIGSAGPVLVNRLVKSAEIIKMSDDIIKPYYLNRLNQAIDWVQSYMMDVPIMIHQPEGAIFLWLWIKDLPITSIELYRRLKAKGVYIIAGEHFFPGLEQEKWSHKYQCIRISYAGNPQSVEKGIMIIADELKQLYAKTAA